MNIQKLKKEELKAIQGGASFAYRVGQVIYIAFKSVTPASYSEAITEAVVNEMYLND